MTSISTFNAAGVNFLFQSKRAKIDGKAVSKLVTFIQGAKHSLDVAIYDMTNADVLKALKGMSTKVQLHIRFGVGWVGQFHGRRTVGAGQQFLHHEFAGHCRRVFQDVR